MRALAVLLLLLTTGCSYMRVDYSSGATISGGTAVSTSSAGLQVSGGRPLAVLIISSALLATAVDSSEPRSSLVDWTRAAPAMQPDRAINEQDCTKPIDPIGNLSGNLRCR